MVAQGKGGATTGKLRPRGEHPRRVPELRVRPLDQAQKPVWHPSWVQDISCTVIRRSPPPQPPPTSGYPLATPRVDQTRMPKPQRQASLRLAGRAASSPRSKIRLVERRESIQRPSPLRRDLPPGWKPRFTGRHDARRHPRGTCQSSLPTAGFGVVRSVQNTLAREQYHQAFDAQRTIAGGVAGTAQVQWIE